MEEKIEPFECPCCGGPGQVKSYNGRFFKQGWVGCKACGLMIQWKVSPVEAVKKWNRRVAA